MKNFKQHGFTLIEIAIVFVIIAVLLSYTFMPLRAQLETKNIKEARSKLVEIEEALYGFAIANNRLPCPTIPGNNGVANPLNPAADCGNANIIGGYIGFVPSNTLGIKGEVNCDGLLIDPWGRPYLYSVAFIDVGANGLGDFVVAGDILTEGGPGAMAANIIKVCNDLTVNCGAAVGAGVASTTNALAVIFTMGTRDRANSTVENENAGEGGTRPSTCGLPAYQIGNDQQYYAAKRIESGVNVFDDIVIWISPNILYSKLLQAGHRLQ
ncbi:MAG: prepilin-type N-terminal cleavage/methylation domain-containing protein [Gammaproteobacteria bacterium]|nr:prepilin-type N-terminal cleavage/methylation domain-containing protein [Gammaproteobacteria bacterium]